MALPTGGFADTTPAGEALDAGSYEIEVVKAVVKQVKDEESDNFGKDYIGLQLRPIDAPDDLFFHNLFPFPKTKRFLMRDLLALGYSEDELKDESFELDADDLVGRKATAIVGVRTYQGEDQNDVKRLTPIGGSEGGLPT